MPDAKKDCPFCDKTLTDSIWFKHILRQHPTQLLDPLTPYGKKNHVWVTRAKVEPGQMPVMYFPKGAERFVCLQCETAVNKRYHIEKHFPVCKEGHVAACMTLIAKVSPAVISHIPVTESTVPSNTKEILAYKKLIAHLINVVVGANIQAWWIDTLDEGLTRDIETADGLTKTIEVFPPGEIGRLKDAFLEQKHPGWSVKNDHAEEVQVVLARYKNEMKHIGLTQEQLLEDAKEGY